MRTCGYMCMLGGGDLRLSSKGQLCRLRQVFVYWADLLRDVCKCPIEKIEAFLLDGQEVILCLLGLFACGLEFPLCASQLALDALKAFNSSHVGSHLFKLSSERCNLFL